MEIAGHDHHDDGTLTWTISGKPQIVTSPRTPSPTATQHQRGRTALQTTRTDHASSPAEQGDGSEVGHGGVPALVLEPAESGEINAKADAGVPRTRTTIEEGVPPAATGLDSGGLASLAATLQEATPPTHAFGRAATTGVPHAMASRGGSPKPSYRVGYTNASAPA